MKTKRLFLNLLLGASLAASMASCSDIDADDRFIELPPVVVENIPKYVLLEEYTGQLCINCPLAHEAIHSLKEQYGNRFIPVSIHCGGPAFSIGEGDIPGVVGLRTPDSESYFQTFASGAGLPCGILSRTSGVLSIDGWSTTIRNEMQLESPIAMALKPATTDDGKLHIAIDMYSNAPVSGKILIWIVESGIEAWQIQPNGTLTTNYIHNHVFRATANGFEGEAINVPANTQIHHVALTDIKDNWNADNLSVVAFIYNDSGVVQAIEAPVGGYEYNEGSIFDETPTDDNSETEEK